MVWLHTFFFVVTLCFVIVYKFIYADNMIKAIKIERSRINAYKRTHAHFSTFKG
jgi:hypothetical protein